MIGPQPAEPMGELCPAVFLYRSDELTLIFAGANPITEFPMCKDDLACFVHSAAAKKESHEPRDV